MKAYRIQIADNAMRYMEDSHSFLPGTREKAIELLVSADKITTAVVMELASILEEGSVREIKEEENDKS